MHLDPKDEIAEGLDSAYQGMFSLLQNAPGIKNGKVVAKRDATGILLTAHDDRAPRKIRLTLTSAD